MKARWKGLIAVAALLTAALPLASGSAAAPARRHPVLLGTTGACNNVLPGGPCTRTSTLVQIDATTGALVRTIGPVGYTVNGLTWDETTHKLYASTAIGDTAFHGLITIDPRTGQGRPVNTAAPNFGLAGNSPVHSVTVNRRGQMVAWYDEFPPGSGDTFVRMNKRTGVGTEFPTTLDTSQNGFAFQKLGRADLLWNIDTPRRQGGVLTQTAYLLDPADGSTILSRPITPATNAALGDFNPENGLYYGLDFVPFDPGAATSLTIVDTTNGTARTLGPTVPDLHVLAFVKED